MNILYLSSEAVPFAKTGGLGDVSGVLPRALAAGENVSLMIPGYMTETSKDPRPKPWTIFPSPSGQRPLRFA